MLNKYLKDFTVEDWVNGSLSETLIRIQVSSEDAPDEEDLSTHPATRIKLLKIEKEYYELLEQNRSLEEQLYNSQCQLRALQASNVYENDKTHNLPETIPELSHFGIKPSPTDIESQSLSRQVYFQKLIIEDLMCKLQNMHHRVEYYKDDVVDLKVQYEKEKISLEAEKQNKTAADEQLQQAQSTILALKSELDTVKTQLAVALKTPQILTKVVLEKSDYQVDTENYMFESSQKDALKSIQRDFLQKLFKIQQSNQITVETLGLSMKKRIDDLKNFYEYRIMSMIQEYSFEEAKFHSKLIKVKNELSECINTIRELENRYSTSERKFLLDKQRSNNAEIVIKNLQEFVDRIGLESIEENSRNKAEIEIWKERTKEVEMDLKHEFQFQKGIAEKQHLDAMESLKQMYRVKIEKINEEFKNNEKKLMERDKREFNTLLEEISRIEKHKTEIEMLTESRVQDVVREAKARYQEYENLLDFNKKKMLEQWNNDRKQIELANEYHIKQLKEEFNEKIYKRTLEVQEKYEKRIENMQAEHLERFKALNKKHYDNVTEIKENHEKIVIGLNANLEKLSNEASHLMKVNLALEADKRLLIDKHEAELAHEQSRFVEIQAAYNELMNIKGKIQATYDEKIMSLNQALSDKEKVLKLKFETEKNIAITHYMQEKSDHDHLYKSKINEITKKLEELSSKYERAKQKKSVIRFSENGSQRLSQEIRERDRIIEQLKREKTNLQASLDYVNSTVRIFSSQEKTFHSKTNSAEPKVPKSSVKSNRFSSTIRF